MNVKGNMNTRRQNVAALIARAKKEDASLSQAALGALLLADVALGKMPHEAREEVVGFTDLLKQGMRELVDAGFLVKRAGGYVLAEDWPGTGSVDTEEPAKPKAQAEPTGPAGAVDVEEGAR